jgi:transcription initiation factor IIE alpha subunit
MVILPWCVSVIAQNHSTALQRVTRVMFASAASDNRGFLLSNAPEWCKNQRSSPARVIVGTETISEIVSNYELTIACEKCGAQTQKTIGWIRLHRDMRCPQCDAILVLNTSRITGTIRSVERRLGDLQNQLTERIRKL